MLFKKSHSVTANTTFSKPDRQKLQIGKGVIVQWIVMFPVEAANLLKIRVEYHGSQVLPFGGTEELYGGGYIFNIPENIEVKDAPYVLDIYAENADTVKNHEYIIMVNVTAEKPIKPGEEVPADWWSKLKGVFGVD